MSGDKRYRSSYARRSKGRSSNKRKGNGQNGNRQNGSRKNGRRGSGRGDRRGILTLLALLILIPFMAYGVEHPHSKAGEAIRWLEARLGEIPFADLSSTGTQTAGEEEVYPFEVHFIDVGQGDATLIRCGDQAMLIDAGENDKGTAIQYYLRKQGVEALTYFVLTHPDSDHIGSADVIITKFNIDHVLMPDYEKDNSTYRQMMEALDYRGMKEEIVAAAEESDNSIDDTPYAVGKSFELGEAVCTILGPIQQYDDPNSSSIVLLVQYGDTRFLFTGDAGKEAESDILAYCADNGISLQADVYKAGHHGSSTSSGEELLEAVKPAYTVISCGEDNSYGHPHKETVERFRMRGIQMFRTDEQGSVVAYSDGTSIVWEMAGK